MRTLCFFAILLFIGPALADDHIWSFVRLGKSGPHWPEWETSSGKATVAMTGDKIIISAFYRQDPSPKFNFEYFPDPSIILEGVIEKNGSVHAIATYQGTDADPVKLKGFYTKKLSHELWGDKMKLVAVEEIVFPYPSNFEFYGFSVRYGVDDK